MDKIFVTGGSGYIGSHTIIYLLESGYEVVALDNLSNSLQSSIDGISCITGKQLDFIKGDIRDSSLLEDIFNRHEFKSVIHFAGLKSVDESILKPLEYYENNVFGTISLLNSMKRNGLKSMVFSSSATVYGNPVNLPIKETDPLGIPTNPYGQSKLFIEKILNDIYMSDQDWKIANLRYFNPVGSHESGLIGENPIGKPNNIMPILAQAALQKIEYIEIYGSDYNTHDGTGIRDYIHVCDLAMGHIKALENISENHGIWNINLGTGIGYSVLDLLKTYELVSGKSIKYKFVDRRPGDIASCFTNPQYAHKLLGWKAYKSLEQMCEDSWRWAVNNNSSK